jgi:NADH-quinone oxidoreductase subunit E
LTTTKQSYIPIPPDKINISKTHESVQPDNNTLLRGLEFLAGYSSSGLDSLSLSVELRQLVDEALRQSKSTGVAESKSDALNQLTGELRQIDSVIDRYGADQEALIQILLDISAQNRWLSKMALFWVARRLNIPLTRVYHTATFYKAFNLAPVGRHLVQVCLGTACQVRGSSGLVEIISSVLHLRPGETDKERRFTLATVNCLGCCSLGPVMMIDDVYFSRPTKSQVQQILEDYK